MAEIIGRKVRVYGRVQGVFFRQWTVKEASALGVNGWVHNARDGSVEAHLAGEESAVAKLIEHMRRGSPQARVDDLTVETVEPETVEGFSVRL
ncbi:acylphosphatase [Sphingomonas sp.]|uniref:acylphosphatase n=1 Tax=Sphingomonas sp. TaxID=28214 RepID=UPI0025DB8A64|nr:acylphosphatase [Sphingomonas sp.]